MTEKDWKELLGRLKVDTARRKLKATSRSKLDAYEKTRGVKLPASYRAYCGVFGAGELAERFKIAVPGYKGPFPSFSLQDVDRQAHDGLEFQLYSNDPEQHKRGIFFCCDLVGSFHFFDPGEVTDKARQEYAVYSLFSDFKVRRTADDFWRFVTESCLGGKYLLLIGGPPPKQTFAPVSQ